MPQCCCSACGSTGTRFASPGAELDTAEGFAGQLGILGPDVHEAAEVLRNRDLQVTAWDAFKQIDVILHPALGAYLALAAAAAMLTGGLLMAGDDARPEVLRAWAPLPTAVTAPIPPPGL